MKNTITFAAILAVSAFATAQESKDIKTEKYDEIVVAGSYTVELVSGIEGEITVSGEADDLKKLVVESDGSTLKIHHNKEFGWKGNKKPVKITVPVESINKVTLSGSGSITGANVIKTNHFEATLSGSGKINLNLDAGEIEVSMSGSGKIELKGKADKFESNISGSGNIKAFELATATANANLSGSGNCEINCSEAIVARISGSGRIHYKGNPAKEDTKIVGSGGVTKS
ncbi:MAG: DUF2807 domain-containing protein [Flavobacterium sp.]|uniref:head GIN domain-containing protein n=1 Tax=Flavobacterium sp. TaxID=239 RepID=UPI001210706D|nr:head GIN domain-containing protein [Flavobacterium sp.]RZJ66614.1 MAG: DUF2807 domain-containing protein [Flavobacterium sp.]